MSSLTIVSRTSQLAMYQAEFIRSQLLHHHPHLIIHILGIKTVADKFTGPLYKMGGKGLFVKELEEALLKGDADLAVHSLKDVPANLPEGLGLAAICERENPFDALICPSKVTFATLPSGSRIGTSSLRRIVQLKKIRPDLDYSPLRGNVDSRLRKCQNGEWDAIVLAVAGLKRLNLLSQITEIFPSEMLLPAVGQGALGLECRLKDKKTWDLLSVLDHAPTRACILAERTMNAALGGNCQVPIAGFAEIQNNKIKLQGKIGDPTSLQMISAQDIGEIDAAEDLGNKVASQLIKKGALEIIATVTSYG